MPMNATAGDSCSSGRSPEDVAAGAGGGEDAAAPAPFDCEPAPAPAAGRAAADIFAYVNEVLGLIIAILNCKHQ